MQPPRDRSREELLEALARAAGNRSRAAQMLGIGRATFYRWLERLGLTPVPPRALADRYEIVAEVSGSAMRLLVARDRARGFIERIVRVVPADADGSSDRGRALAEMRLLTRLRHPNLVRVVDAGLDPETDDLYLVMDEVPGQPVAATGRLPAELLGALDALALLHAHDLVHRDLRPASILEAPPEAVPHLTLLEPAVMVCRRRGEGWPVAPELAAGAPCSVRSDIYAVGALLHMLAAQRPPEPGDPAAVPDWPAPLALVLRRALAVDPRERYSDVRALLEDLAPVFSAAAPAQPGRRVESIGRETECSRLLRLLADGPVPVVLGEPGIGKTHIVSRTLDDLRRAGVRVARASAAAGCSPALAALFAQAIDSPDRVPDAIPPEHRQAIAVIAPGLIHGLDGDPGSPALPVAPAEDAVAAAVAWLATRPEGLVLAIDDFHQADATLAAIVQRIVRAGVVRLVLVMQPAGTDVPGGALLAEASAEGLVSVIEVGPLDARGVRTMAEARLGPAFAATWAERVFDATGGNPRFIEEALAALCDGRGRSDGLPPTLREAIAGRLDALPASRRLLLAAISAAGHPVRPEELGAIVDADDAALELPALTAAGLLATDPDGALRPAHALLGSIAAAQASAEERQRWHARWAAFLAGRDDRIVDRAEHLLALGVGCAEHQLFIKAAQRLAASLRPLDAVALLERALTRCPVEAACQAVYLAALEQVLTGLRNVQRALPHLEQLVRSTTALGDIAAQARALMLLAGGYRDAGDISRALQAAESAAAMAHAADDPDVVDSTERVLATVRFTAWNHRGAALVLDRVIEHERTRAQGGAGAARRVALALHDAIVPFALTGRVEDAFAAIDEARQAFAASADRYWTAAVDAQAARALAFDGNVDGAIAAAQRAVTALRRDGAVIPAGHALETLAFLLLRAGRYEAALEVARDLIGDATRFDHGGQRVSGLLVTAEALFWLDDGAGARENRRLAHDLARVLRAPGQDLFARLALARELRSSGHVSAAECEAAEAESIAASERRRRPGVLAMIERARCRLALGDPSRALTALERAEGLMTTTYEDAPAHRAALLATRARAWHALGRASLAAAVVEEAWGIARRAGAFEAEVEVLAIMAKLRSDADDSSGAARAYVTAASAIRPRADVIADPLRRARFLARPDLAELIDRADRDAGIAGGWRALAGRPLDALREVTQALALGRDPSAVAHRIAALAAERLPGARVALVVRAAGGPQVVALSNPAPGFVDRAIAATARRIARDSPDDGELVLLPLQTRTEQLGALCVLAAGPVADDDRAALGGLAELATLALVPRLRAAGVIAGPDPGAVTPRRAE